MWRRPRLAAGGLVYHVLNRRVGHLPLLEKPGDYAAFEEILAEAHARSGVRITAYSLMPNHWQLLLCPRQEGELSEVLRWVSVTHTQRWYAHRKSAGTGPVYQGRFKSFAVQTDEHFLTVARYVERNALRAKLVARAEAWGWCSLWRRTQSDGVLTAWLSAWPLAAPGGWLARVNRAQGAAELEALRTSVQRGRPVEFRNAWALLDEMGSRRQRRGGEVDGVAVGVLASTMNETRSPSFTARLGMNCRAGGRGPLLASASSRL